MIVVTGAGGFLGKYVVRELGAGVIPVDRAMADVTRPGAFDGLAGHSIDAFIHLAALIPAKAPDMRSDAFIRVNTLGAFYALEFCRRNKIPKFVLATTMYEALAHTEMPIAESMGRKYSLTGDHAAYVISKVAAAELVAHYSREYGIQGIILRLVGLIGRGRRPGAFEVFYNKAVAGLPLEIWGEHTARRDSLYVKDAAQAVHAAVVSSCAQGLYNISSGIGRTVEEEVRIFAEIFGAPIVYRPEIPDKKQTYWFDNARAARDLEWVPEYDYRAIIRDYHGEASC